jgi:hypothetical protein
MPPKYIFIIPYRDREQHLHFFNRQMKYVLEDIPKEDYEIYFLHQCDVRKFNRGAMKNIGFLAIRDKYPNDYKNITLVFNDIDTMPFEKNVLNYKTVPGVIKHFYGYKFALGGIVSITGDDFEKMNGFPNFWAWGYEDNSLQNRATRLNFIIDRSQLPDVEGEIYYKDLEGKAVLDCHGTPMGHVVHVHDFGAGPILELSETGLMISFYAIVDGGSDVLQLKSALETFL